jgi:hypothetical protein
LSDNLLGAIESLALHKPLNRPAFAGGSRS